MGKVKNILAFIEGLPYNIQLVNDTRKRKEKSICSVFLFYQKRLMMEWLQ